MIDLGQRLTASTAMPQLLNVLARVYSLRECGLDLVLGTEKQMLHSFTPSAELALGYASEPIRDTARHMVQQHLERWWADRFQLVSEDERQDLELLAVQLTQIYVHHLRCLPGRTEAEMQSAGFGEDGQ